MILEYETGADGDDEEGLYFDQLSAVEQEKYDKNMEALRALEAEEEAKKDAQKRSNTNAAVQANKDKQQPRDHANPTSASRLTNRRSSLATGYGSDEESGGDATGCKTSGTGDTAPVGVVSEGVVLRCWRREPGDNDTVLLVASNSTYMRL